MYGFRFDVMDFKPEEESPGEAIRRIIRRVTTKKV